MTAGNSSKLKSQPQSDCHLRRDGEIGQETVSGFGRENGYHTGPITFKVVVSEFRPELPCTWTWWNYQTLLMASLPLPWPPLALVGFWHFFVPCVVLMCFSISWSIFSGDCFQQEPLSVRCSELSLVTPSPHMQLHLRDHYPLSLRSPRGVTNCRALLLQTKAGVNVFIKLLCSHIPKETHEF